MTIKRRKGTTLIDAVCGLFIFSLGTGLYFQTNQIMQHQLMVSNHQLVQERMNYEKTISKNK